MPLPGSLVERLCEQLSRHLGTPVDVEQATPVGGGSINDAYRLETDAGRFFVKTNDADRYPSLFQAEADGLRRLRTTRTIGTPQVIAYGEDHDTTYLLLTWVEAGRPAPDRTTAFGHALARLHAHTAPTFGLEKDNYIGTLPQRNLPDRQAGAPHATWAEFYLHSRLEPLVKQAYDRHRLPPGDAVRFERLFARLPDLFPVEPPALLHGDLWSGNLLTGPDGHAWVVDPAVYYGHREMDLAMLQLFGGAAPELWDAYQELAPLGPGWRERVDLCNLYPLLVHTLLFGGSYAAQVGAVLRRFV